MYDKRSLPTPAVSHRLICICMPARKTIMQGSDCTYWHPFPINIHLLNIYYWRHRYQVRLLVRLYITSQVHQMSLNSTIVFVIQTTDATLWEWSINSSSEAMLNLPTVVISDQCPMIFQHDLNRHTHTHTRVHLHTHTLSKRDNTLATRASNILCFWSVFSR